MGSMMSYTDGRIIQLQLAEFSKLGIRTEATPELERLAPALAALWALEQEDAFVFATLTPHQVRELYYGLQTAALFFFRECLLADGLATIDQAAYVRIFGDLPEIILNADQRPLPMDNAFMAFSWDPDRGGDDTWAALAEVLRNETRETVDLAGRRTVIFPALLWAGFSEAQRAMAAGVTLFQGLHFGSKATSLMESALGSRPSNYVQALLSATITPNPGLSKGTTMTPGKWVSYNWQDEKPTVEFSVELLEDGFRVLSRPYVAPPKPTPAHLPPANNKFGEYLHREVDHAAVIFFNANYRKFKSPAAALEYLATSLTPTVIAHEVVAGALTLMFQENRRNTGAAIGARLERMRTLISREAQV